MSANAARMEFAPPPTRGLMRGLGLAILAHGLLVAVLTIGVQWKRDPVPVTVEAELWSTVPEQAAPPPMPDPPAAPPEAVLAHTPVVAPPAPDPSIAIAQEKVRLQKQKKLEQVRLEQVRRNSDALKAKKMADEKELRDRELRDRLARDKKIQIDQQKARTATTEAEAKKMAEIRKQQIDRMTRLAGQETGSDGPGSTGSAKQSSGPSASYGGRIQARVRPNITYTETPSNNSAAEVEVRTSPDGTIINRKLVKSSGIKSWDDAVLNAIDKTEVLPRDVDGRVPPILTLVFRPKD